ncbi:DNA-formamidopyrimidine glycosylase [Candidatus Peregrinibacteria bacterium CG1_02_41_10]|nr:MAG: DNA-formamidopyrimidine glycosylase [Candidatus Peregrinibacteria bacterium CG1_02_41_10]
MPELPEVETQTRDLQKSLLGRKVIRIWTDTPKALHPSLRIFQTELVGKKIVRVTRRAKYVLIELENLIWVTHFRMTGHFLVRQSGVPREKFVRHIFYLDNGLELRLEDIRKFGEMSLIYSKKQSRTLWEQPGSDPVFPIWRESEQVWKKLNQLGPEPLDKGFTLLKFKTILKGKKGSLKQKLMDQNLVAGIGNIYADEICFESKLHPLSRLEKLSLTQIKKLHEVIRQVLKRGIQYRGTTIGEFVDTKGRPGGFQNLVQAYGRKGKPCLCCGTLLKRIVVGQRGTVFCPKCQKLVS